MDYTSYIKEYQKNRICLYFSDIPSFLVRSILKSNGWWYQAEEMCWVTRLSNDAEKIAKSIGAVDGTPPESNPKFNESAMDINALRTSANLMFNTNIFSFASLEDIGKFVADYEGATPKLFKDSDKDFKCHDKDFIIVLTSCRNDEIKFFFVDDDKSTDNEEIFSIQSDFAKEIINRIIEQKYYLLYHHEVYRISKIYWSDYLYNIVFHSCKIKKNLAGTPIIVYKLKMPCAGHQEDVQSVTAHVLTRKNIRRPINIYYCPICQKYYINAEQYKEFSKRYGLPYLKLVTTTNNGNTTNYNEWHNESVLHYMGYNVSSLEDLSTKERQHILKHAIVTETMTKAQVTSFLEFLIYRNENNFKFENACGKWREDLEYIRNYNMDNQSQINGYFKPNV